MRHEKTLLLNEVKASVQAESFMIMRYTGVKANKANEIRRELGKIGGAIEIVPKRLLMKAVAEQEIVLSKSDLEGHVGVIYTDGNPFEATKVVFKISKENEKAIVVIAGKIEGRFYNAEEMEALSKLPSLSEMRAQLLSVFEAPLSQTCAVMDSIVASIVHCLENKRQKEEGASE